MKSWLFEFWFERLLECISPGHWFILDNSTFHRENVLRQMAEAKGCHVLMLPKYSPDLNKIELEWANLKSFLRNHGRLYVSVQFAVCHYFKSA
jgi:transposase